MTAVVVPFRAGKTRLALAEQERTEVALSMLRAVVAAAVEVGRTLVVTDDDVGRAVAEQLGAEPVADPGGGQARAVAAALDRLPPRPVLVVNADLPLATADDLRSLAAAAPALVAARDGTTNALALSEPAAFRPLYGPGSARRFAALGLRAVELPNLAEDVDTVEDVERLRLASATPT